LIRIDKGWFSLDLLFVHYSNPVGRRAMLDDLNATIAAARTRQNPPANRAS
jgi:hypothetical protein